MSRKQGLICAVAFSMLAAGVAGIASGETNANALAHRAHEGRGLGGRFMADFEQLNLTSNQTQQIASIRKAEQEPMQAAMKQAQEAREAQEKQLQEGPFDEQSVRAACKKAAAAGEEAAVLRAKIAGQIRAILTSDQQAAWDKMRADERSAMQKRFAKDRGKMDKPHAGQSAP